MKSVVAVLVVALAACVAGYTQKQPPYTHCPFTKSSAYACPHADNWYLNEDRRCSVDREYIVEPLEKACEAVWNFITQTADCNFWFVTNAYVMEIMQKGCFLADDDANGQPQFVLGDEAAVEMLNTIIQNDLCTYKGNGSLIKLEDVKGDLLNRYKNDPCSSMVKGGGTSRIVVDAFGQEAVSRSEECKNWLDRCTNCTSKRIQRSSGGTCDMCCPNSCLNGSEEFIKICCTRVKQETACACTKNNPGSACWCD